MKCVWTHLNQTCVTVKNSVNVIYNKKQNHVAPPCEAPDLQVRKHCMCTQWTRRPMKLM